VQSDHRDRRLHDERGENAHAAGDEQPQGVIDQAHPMAPARSPTTAYGEAAFGEISRHQFGGGEHAHGGNHSPELVHGRLVKQGRPQGEVGAKVGAEERQP
jgi:hypothetical protein